MKSGIIITIGRQMKSRIWMLGALPFILAAGCSEGFARATENRDDSFIVGESPQIVVSGGNGRIIVNSGSDGTMRVQATLKRPDDLEYKTTQEGDTITVEAKAKGRGIFNFWKSLGVDIEITAPSNTKVDLQTSNGSVEVHGLQQSGTIRTSNGTIAMEDVSGEFDVSTSNGSVRIGRASGTFEIDTSNGGIEFDGELAAGSVNRMTTSNGGVKIKLQGTPSVKLDASTSNGTIVVRLPILTTSPGNVEHVVGTIGNGDAELFVRTSNGSVTIQ